MLKKIIPKKYHYQLSNVKNAIVGGYAQTHYSQFGEDIVVTRLLREPHGWYVDVGAHHPKRYSNTYLLFRRGWQGVNIDANPHTIQLFQKARPKDANICVGVGGKAGTLTYHQFSDPAVNSFKEDEAKKWMGKDWITYLGPREVPVRPLRDILREVSGLPRIDLLTIDVEGMDLEVLQSNDWETYTPTVIIVECADYDPHASEHPIVMYLRARGYVLAAFVGSSLIFSRHA